MLFLVFLLPKTEKFSKANTGESAVKLSEHVAEASEVYIQCLRAPDVIITTPPKRG